MARRPPRPPPGGGPSGFDGVGRASAYARNVLAGLVPACRLARLACERFQRDMAAAEGGKGPWEFRPARAEAKIALAEMLPHIKGPLAGQPMRLSGWQCFAYANLFGWYERNTDARRFRQAFIFVPRGNGKSSFVAPIALGMTFCEGEGGAEGFAAAVTRDQARIVFEIAKEMVRRSPKFQQAFGVRTSKDAIYQEASASNFVPISSDAKALDGKNVHVCVLDEIGSHRTPEVYDVMLTGMGKRTHPMMLAISTATGNTAGIGKQQWDYCVRVLQGKDTDERLFALIYTVDDGDDVWDEATWIKANPNWGVSVQPDAVRAIMRQARSNPAREAAVMTRHLNVWTGADEALFSMRAWRARAEPTLRPEDFEGREAHIALDLASKVDLASCAVTFPATSGDGALSYVTFSQSFLNEQAVLEARHASYPGWAAEGFLHVTPGNETDFAVIEDWLLDCCRRFRVLSVAYDPWAATQFAQRMMAQDVPMVEFRATTQNFSEPTKELDAAIHGGRLRHEGDPVLEWAIGNVVGRYDARANVYPRKSREQNKIDPAIALIMTIGRCMAGAEAESSYNRPGARPSIWIADEPNAPGRGQRLRPNGAPDPAEPQDQPRNSLKGWVKHLLESIKGPQSGKRTR